MAIALGAANGGAVTARASWWPASAVLVVAPHGVIAGLVVELPRGRGDVRSAGGAYTCPAAGQNLGVKEMGFALAIAVAVDATLIRCILVPRP